METKTDWKRFEEHVGRFESLLASVNARVKTNDQILDRYGELRQVDASIRIDTGSTELLIIIECRKRKKISDSTWVEQVASKRDNLRADKAILVSNRELTAPAQRMANDKGIDVRTLSEIDKSLLPYTFPTRFEFGTLAWKSFELKIVPMDVERFSSSLTVIREALESDQSNVLFILSTGESLPISDAVDRAFVGRELPSLPPDAQTAEVEVKLFAPPLTAKLRHGKSEVELAAASVVGTAEYQAKEQSQPYYGDYSSSSKRADHFVSSVDAKLGEHNVTFTAAAKKGTEGFVVNIPYAFMNEDVRVDVDPEKGVNIELGFDATGAPTLRRVR